MKRANGMGSIIHLSGNRRRPYGVRVTENIYGKVHKRYVSYHATREEAERALILESLKPTHLKANYSLQKLFDEWRGQYFRHISKGTQDCYYSAYNVIKPIGSMKFREIRGFDIQDLIDESDKSLSVKGT